MDTNNKFQQFISSLEKKKLSGNQESLVLTNSMELMSGTGNTNRACSNTVTSCNGSQNRNCTNIMTEDVQAPQIVVGEVVLIHKLYNQLHKF